MSLSPRLQLPLLSPGQAQKEMTHNEALQALDHLVSACVEEPPLQTAPAAAAVGSTYIVAALPTGSWSLFPHHLATFTIGGWRFIAPAEGLRAIIRTTGAMAVYRSGVWEIGIVTGTKLVLGGHQVVGAQGVAIANPSGGTVIDTAARSAIIEVLNSLRLHGLIA
jgi:hypothetical protein